MAAAPILNKIEPNSLDNKFATECKIAMQWSIKEKTLRETKQKFLISTEFAASKIPGLKYGLMLAPNGIDDDKPEELWAFLSLKFVNAKKINADFIISVKSASKDIEISHDYVKPTCWGVKLGTHDFVFDSEKNFFVDGIMTIQLEAALKPEGLKTNAPSINPNLLTQALWEKDDKDISLFVENEFIMIHKWILTIRSPVFEAMFRSGMKEEKENKVVITDFDAEIVEIAVKFCYERDIKPFITDENAAELLKFADKYDMPNMRFPIILSAIIESYLIETLSDDNVCQYANMAVASNCKELREFCVCFLMKYFVPPSYLGDIHILENEIKVEIANRIVYPTAEAL